MVRSYRVPGDNHALQHALRIAFQDTAVHERTRVAFVGIADDELRRTCGLGNRAPLETCRIAGSPATARATARDLFDDPGGSHVGEGFDERLIAASGDVILDALRVDAA